MARARSCPGDRVDAGLQAGEQLGVAGNRPRVEHREQEFGVGDVEIGEIGELAHLVADHQLEVPQRLEHGVDEPLLVATDGAVEQNHQIDVGMQTERAAAVAAERTHHQRPRGLCPGRLDQLQHHFVHARGMARLRLAAAAPLPGLERELAAGGGERRRHLRPPRARVRHAAGRVVARAARRVSGTRITGHQPTPHGSPFAEAECVQ